jgi:hypothetical protein
VPLCEQCALSAGKEGYKCIGCAGVGAAEKLEARQVEREERRTELKAKKKKPLELRHTIGLSFVALIILLNVIVYLKASIPAGETPTPAEHPIPIMFVLDQAIREYAADHQQEVPPSLEVVLGEYIPSEAMSAKDLGHFNYRKTSRYTYELQVAPSNTQSGPKLVLTEKGVGE